MSGRPRALLTATLATVAAILSLGLVRALATNVPVTGPATSPGNPFKQSRDEDTPMDRSLTPSDLAPGDEQEGDNDPAPGLIGYTVGLGLAILLTLVSFAVAGTDLVWLPSLPIALSVLAIAQMGVHLVFFLHIGSGPDSTNNIMALAFGILIVFLLITGSLWIMGHLNHNMMPMNKVMQMQR